MLQNRVDPLGNIIKTPARGAWMGNRGIIHDPNQHIVRPFKLLAWITCLLEFKERKRPVMAPDRYTELFFMDEATSFAAGHRPCFECRRADAVRFKSFWLKGNPEYGFHEKTPITEIDKIIHRERMDRSHSKITYEENPCAIPDGAFILFKQEPWLVFDGSMYLWSPSGYSRKTALPDAKTLTVLTPKSFANTFHAGYLPQMASFAG